MEFTMTIVMAGLDGRTGWQPSMNIICFTVATFASNIFGTTAFLSMSTLAVVNFGCGFGLPGESMHYSL
jgi:hypothetical protein